ncbi:DegV family protein [Alkalihalobacillus pseudalcaliphilus]|uniref:DegV family protein n=1 Tax=Alkalihalobacillus pseudalcaliphilus TaxID=79884 RepID=UPI00064E0E8D|nr:DegV family protein [Alkalihalobacillus pseudalcaliphilus]KMK77421.1 DegV domain-containing protein [Alkalihalobacillus pseudalcaliphilus]
MRKVAVVTDSTAYLPKELRKKLDVYMVPLNVVFGQESLLEEVDITAAEFYERMKGEKNLPTTSQPAIGQFAELFEDLAKKGYEQVVSIHLSSKISGTFQSAMAAADMVESIEVFGYDSAISCSPQAQLVFEAVRLAEDGKKAEEIVVHLDKVKETLRAYFVVDDLNHLHRGGRLNAAQLFVGNLLKIKPILHLVEGKIVPYEKVRTEKKAFAKIKTLLEQEVSKSGEFQVTIIHANCEDEATKLMEDFKASFPEATFNLSYFGPVIGTHLGQGSIGITWSKKVD